MHTIEVTPGEQSAPSVFNAVLVRLPVVIMALLLAAAPLLA